MRRRTGFARRLSAREHRDMHYGPNMTPMVDIVMVILVFFMASTAVMGPEWMLKSALPVKAAAAKPAADDPSVRLEVSVRMEGGTCVVEGAGIARGSLDDLGARLSEAARAGADKVALLVTCTGDVPYEAIVRMHEMCEKLGVTRIGLIDSKVSGGVTPGAAGAGAEGAGGK